MFWPAQGRHLRCPESEKMSNKQNVPRFKLGEGETRAHRLLLKMHVYGLLAEMNELKTRVEALERENRALQARIAEVECELL
jgi:hypothetical protein